MKDALPHRKGASFGPVDPIHHHRPPRHTPAASRPTTYMTDNTRVMICLNHAQYYSEHWKLVSRVSGLPSSSFQNSQRMSQKQRRTSA